MGLCAFVRGVWGAHWWYMCVLCACLCICVVCVGICMMWRPLPLITTDGYSLCYSPPNATSPVGPESIHTMLPVQSTWTGEERRITSFVNS